MSHLKLASILNQVGKTPQLEKTALKPPNPTQSQKILKALGIVGGTAAVGTLIHNIGSAPAVNQPDNTLPDASQEKPAKNPNEEVLNYDNERPNDEGDISRPVPIKDDGSGTVTTGEATSDTLNVTPTPTPIDTTITNPIENPPQNPTSQPPKPPTTNTQSDLDNYYNQVEQTQDTSKINQRLREWDEINSLLKTNSYKPSKAELVFTKLATKKSTGNLKYTYEGPAWVHNEGTDRFNDIMESMKLDPALYSQAAADTLKFKDDVGTGIDMTHWAVPKDKNQDPVVQNKQEQNFVGTQPLDVMGNYLKYIKEVQGRTVNQDPTNK